MSMMSSTSADSARSSPDGATPPADRHAAQESPRHPGARINLLLKANHALWATCISRALEPYGLAHNAYVTLLAMHSRPDWVANPSLLAGVIAETATNTTRICDRLTRRGLIRRVNSINDRRRVDLTLTEAGEALVAAVEPRIDRLLDEAFSVFTSEERAALERMLERLNDGLSWRCSALQLRAPHK